MKIFRRGSKYWLDLTIGETRHRVSLGVDEYGLALDRAREKERELRAVAAGKPVGGLTFEDFGPKYLAWAQDTKPATVRTERYYLKTMIGYFATQKIFRLDDVTPGIVEQFRVWIRSQDRRVNPIKGHPPRYPGKATANRYCAVLKKFYNLAISWKAYGGANPVSEVKFYRAEGKIIPMSPDDLEKVMTAAREFSANPSSRVHRVIADLIELSVNTGLRKSEALNLRWKDIGNDEIDIRGKGEKDRRVPLNDNARAIIERQPKIGPFVFDVPNRSKPDALRLTVNQIRERSGVHHFRFHLCRHYFTSSLLAAGVDLQTISELLGHSRIMTTLIYSHSTPQRRRDAVAALGTISRHTPIHAQTEQRH